jgi:putative oxidoreductase
LTGIISALRFYQLITFDLLSYLWRQILGVWPVKKISALEEHKMLAGLIDTDGDWLFMIVRVVLGVVLFAHGAQKLLGWFGGPGLRATLHTFRDQMRIPVALACLAIAAEFFGGLGLIVGLLTRIAALSIALTMTVALTYHSKYGFFLNWFGNKPGHGVEYHLVVIALAVVVLVKGAGAFSFDLALSRLPADSSNVASSSMRGNYK